VAKLRPGAREESLRLTAEKKGFRSWRVGGYGFFRKGSEHLIPNGTVGDTPAPRGNAALRSQALPKVLVIGFHPHPPAAHRGERLVPTHPAIPAERAQSHPGP